MSLLPPGFAALEPFVDQWSIAGADNRRLARIASTQDERAAFHAAAGPLLQEMIEFLDARPLRAMDAAETRLMSLLLAFAHVSIAVERQRENEPAQAARLSKFTVTRAMADL